jgi:hypothetical protein
MALTFQKGDGEKIYITKLTRNDDKVVNALSVNDVEYYNDYFFIKADGTGRDCIQAYTGRLPSEVVVPSNYKGQTVTGVYPSGFYNCTKLVRVIIQEGITFIGSGAFRNCTSLEEIVIPSNVEQIIDEAFLGCSSLVTIALPDKIVFIQQRTFEGCTSLSSIVFADKVRYIQKDAFKGCTALTKVYYKGTATDWGSIDIKDGNDYLKNATRYYYSATKPTTSGNYWHYVDGEIFEWDGSACENGHDWGQTCTTSNTCSVCGATKGETFEHTWGEWEMTKRQNCTEAGEKTRTCSVCGEQEIEACGSAIGHDYEGGVNVVLPTCTEKGYEEQLCLRCGEYIKNEIEPLGHDWGDWYQDEATGNYYCDCLRCGHQKIQQAEPYVYTLLDDGTYSVSGGDGVSGDIFIPSEHNGKPVISIADYAFLLRPLITSVIIDNGITSIGKSAFDQCANLARVEIPASVIIIGDYAFSSCDSLVRVELPEGIEAISKGMFAFCRKLEGVNIPASVASIGDSAFAECSSIAEIILPDGVTSIGKYAFESCYSLTKLFIPAEVIKIGYGAFKNCPNLSIEVDENNKYYRMREGCLWEIETSTIIHGEYAEIPDDTTAIGGGAFYGNTYFAPIKIPLSVTNIGSLAFGGKPVTVHVEATSKPEDWADDWCDDSVTVVWGYKEEDDTCSHEYSGWLTTALPTCTRFGSMERTCSICGNVDIALIDPLEHEYETVVTEPTCLTKGYTDYICKRCGTQLRKDYTSSLGHEWDEGFVRIEPTCTTNGVRRHTCTRCGDTVEVGISALRHDWGEWSHVHPAECEIDGTDSRYCKRCGEEEIQNVPATGHDWDVDVEVVEPTCTDGGYTIHTCNYCGATKRDNYTEPLGHNIVNGICTRCDNDTRGVVYYGVAAIPERYNSAFVLGLDQKVPSNSHLTSISATPLEGEYIYYCVPTSFGDCSFAYNNFVGGFSLIIEGLALTNAGGKTESYNIYKSNQANLGANGEITISIIGTGG